ncbi:MAG: hypothetical protein QXX72_01055 [Desulfurococcaceae archaeon]
MISLKPVYGLGLFFVRDTGLVEQVVIFDYYDELEEYKSIVKDPEKLENEKSMLATNMQHFLDQEDVRLNNEPTYPKVVDVEIGFRGDYKHPYIAFFIVFQGVLRKGLNVYEDRYEPETTEYDYRVYWFFPSRARVIRADLDVPYSLLNRGRILSFCVKTGTFLRGYERIEFELY